MMKSAQDFKQLLPLAALTLTLAFGANVRAATEQPTPTLVEPSRPSEAIKLYKAAGDKESIRDAPKDAPLHVSGAPKGGFYPVVVQGQTYWVDGMAVKLHRGTGAQCSESASIHAAGTLGAATNRCQ